MKSAISLAIALIAILLACQANTEELRAFRQNASFGCRAIDLNLPFEVLHRSAKSGLSTSFLAIVSAYYREKIFQTQEWSVKYHFDLWDEKFILQLRGPGKNIEAKFKTEAELFSGLTNLKFTSLWTREQLPAQFQIKLRLVLDPIDKEKALQIRKWISQNILPQGGSSQSDGGRLPNGVTATAGSKIAQATSAVPSAVAPLHFSGLFQKIVDRKNDASQPEGAWSLEVSSDVLQLKDVPNED